MEMEDGVRDGNHEHVIDEFSKFVTIIERLRKECPWDREQTHASIKHLLIEEAYETVEAIENDDLDELKKELGDLLLHVVFHSVIAAETGSFHLDEVIRLESEKLIRRHPHVFAETDVKDTGEVLANWEKIKREEGGRRSVTAGVPASLPSLLRAHRIQEKVSGVGFDFPDGEDAWKKVEEELGEFRRHVKTGAEHDDLEDEFGDVLFALVNYARFVDVNPENALRRTNEKFNRRFRFIEQRLTEQGREFDQLSLAEMDEIWDEAKAEEKAS